MKNAFIISMLILSTHAAVLSNNDLEQKIRAEMTAENNAIEARRVAILERDLAEQKRLMDEFSEAKKEYVSIMLALEKTAPALFEHCVKPHVSYQNNEQFIDYESKTDIQQCMQSHITTLANKIIELGLNAPD